MGFPGGSGKEPTCHCRRCKRRVFDPWVRKISWSRKWQTGSIFLPRKVQGQGSLGGYNPRITELDTTEPVCACARTHTHTHTHTHIISWKLNTKYYILSVPWEILTGSFLHSLKPHKYWKWFFCWNFPLLMVGLEVYSLFVCSHIFIHKVLVPCWRISFSR